MWLRGRLVLRCDRGARRGGDTIWFIPPLLCILKRLQLKCPNIKLGFLRANVLRNIHVVRPLKVFSNCFNRQIIFSLKIYLEPRFFFGIGYLFLRPTLLEILSFTFRKFRSNGKVDLTISWRSFREMVDLFSLCSVLAKVW